MVKKSYTEDEAVDNGWHGLENPYVYDGLCAWIDPKTKEIYPIEGREDLFELHLKMLNKDKQ